MLPRSALTVRPYRDSDRAVIEKLIDDFQDFFVVLDPLQRERREPGYATSYLDQMLRLVADTEGSFMVADVDGALIGFAVGVVHNSTPEEELEAVPTRTGRVQELFVAETHRDRGIGGDLLGAMEDRFRTQGCDAVRIEVFAPNVNARRFYERHGYVPREIDQIKLLEASKPTTREPGAQ